MTQTYGSYLMLERLLSAQRPVSEGPEHDEMLFIVIHQVYELWFKQMLHEADFLLGGLQARDTPRVLHTLKRMLTVLKTMVVQVDILETMTPLSFSSFRSRLESSSGFQSAQFREWEAVLGFRRQRSLAQFPEGSAERARVEARFAQPTLWQAFLGYLRAQGHPVPDVAPSETPSPTPEVQRVLVDVYRGHPLEAQVCERLVDLDEGVQEWRYRHVKMVERTIGTKTGTGGSSGAEYLRRTLFQPAFPDLWAIRVEL